MPTTIPRTNRQRVTTKAGIKLERSYVFMDTASWEALQRLCDQQGRSGSQVIQSLIAIASIGKQKDKINDSTATH
jgi:hypothetical protein